MQYLRLRPSKAGYSDCFCTYVGNCPGKMGYPALLRQVENILGIKFSCIYKVKMVCASIGSQGIPVRRDTLTRWGHKYRPLEVPWRGKPCLFHFFHFIFIYFRDGGPSASAGFQGALHLLYNILYNTIKNKAKAYH